MHSDVYRVSPAKNLCTDILSFDPYSDEKQIAFEPNLSSVWCRDGHALSVKDIPSTAVTNTIFNTQPNMSQISIEVWKFTPGKCFLLGIVPQLPTQHYNHVIGDTGFPSFGIELMYIPSSNRNISTRIQIRFVESPSVEKDINSSDGMGFCIRSKESLGKDVVSIEYAQNLFKFSCNGQHIYSTEKRSFERFRIGVSFLGPRQEVRIISPCEKLNHKVSPFDQGVFLSLPQKPGGTGTHTFVSNSRALLISGDSLLCTSDTTHTAVTAEIFRNLGWENTACRICATKSIQSNKWLCMDCADFDLCQTCFGNFSAENQNHKAHPHAADRFTCALGGEFHDIAFRIDDFDDDGFSMFFGIVPSLYTLGPNYIGRDASSYAMQIGKKLSIWDQGAEITVAYSRSPLVGDIVCVAMERNYIRFSINGCAVYTVKIQPDLYRFAVTLQRSNQALSVVSRDFAHCIPRGALVQITADRSSMQEYSESCSVQASFDVLGCRGTVVDVDDSDGTVGVSFKDTFKWIPRRCCHVKLSPEKNSWTFRHALAVPYEGDCIFIHPCAPDGWKALRGGFMATILQAHVVRTGTEGIDGCVMYKLLLSSSMHCEKGASYSLNHHIAHKTVGSLLIDLEVSFQVVRNPYFWRWGTQDGHFGDNSDSSNLAFGWVVEVPLNGWVTVYWEKTRVCEKYRFGCDNAFDVSCVRRPTDVGYQPRGFVPDLSAYTLRNLETYTTFIKECHFIPRKELQFSAASELGRGRFGIVHKGTWRATDVAIKEISHPDIHQARDLGVLSRITHPNAVRILGWSADEANTIYLVMRLVTPGSLAKVIRALPEADASNGGPLGWDHFFDISIGVAHALHYFTRQDLVHRDIKPENILLEYTDDVYVVRVTDFGLAKFIRREESADLTNVCGTPAYMSPEAWDTGKRMSVKADIFSLGLVMYNMLTGKTPRSECENAFQILYDLVTLKNTVQPPPDTPSALAALILSCQNIDPSERPTAMDVIRHLHEIQQNIRTAWKVDSPTGSDTDSTSFFSSDPSTMDGAESPTSMSSTVRPSLRSRDMDGHRELKPRNVPYSDFAVATPPENVLECITPDDLTQYLGFTYESARILLLIPEVKKQIVPPIDENFTEDKRRLVLHETIDQFLISMKLVAVQTKMNYEHLFSLITKAEIPVLAKRSVDGVKTYFVLLKHYSKLLSAALAHNALHQMPSPLLPKQQRLFFSVKDGPQSRHQLHRLVESPEETNNSSLELSPSKQTCGDGRLQNIRFDPPTEQPFAKGQFTMKYLSFKNFCAFADLASLSLMSLINHKVIIPKRIFGQTYRISCDQKEIIEDSTIPIEKFQASCALTSTEIRAFALVLNVPVLYRPKARIFCLLYDDISERVMPAIDRAARIHSRSDFLTFLQVSKTDAVILEERGMLKRYLAFDRAQIFDHITKIMQNLVPMLLARQEIQSMLDLTPAEFDEMLKEYVDAEAMHGSIHIKGVAYLLREEVQLLIQEFSECM